MMVSNQDTNKQPMPIIEIKNLGTRFGDTWVHKNLNLTIYPSRIVNIIGSSGSGKTTLVHEILMLQPITEGEIYFSGKKISNYNIEDAATKEILSQVGMMFQHCALFSSLSVLENVMFPLVEYTNFSTQTIREIAQIKLRLTGLPDNAYNLYPKDMSGGMLKRVALARTLALDPKVIFLDEPTAGLDPNSANGFDELISDLQKRLNLTVVLITHDLDTIWNIADEIVYLGEKRVLFHDTVEKAANAESIPELYEYFNGARGQITKTFYTK
ncbi:MAG: transporter ATP-binding protein [Burkholderiales bacterium]|jgi:phospholipid/cholesterol/gamma-HCH transport system ATP-binding protein|nr:transporter ATP-binding protein [Burkholderiales bacterium]